MRLPRLLTTNTRQLEILVTTLNFKKNFVVVVAVVLIHFNTLGEEGRGFFNPMYFLFSVSGPYKRGSLLATVYGILFFTSSVPVA